jgi:uncharacterized membrane protein
MVELFLMVYFVVRTAIFTTLKVEEEVEKGIQRDVARSGLLLIQGVLNSLCLLLCWNYHWVIVLYILGDAVSIPKMYKKYIED